MKKNIFYLILSLLLISCNLENKYEKNLQTMSDIFKQYMQDNAFKDNSTIDFLIFQPIKYDTVFSIVNDIRLMNAYLKEMERHNKQVKLNNLKIEREVSLFNLCKLTNDRSGMNSSKRDITKLKKIQDKELKILDDISKHMDEIDSIVKQKDSTEIIYQLKVFVKATFKDKNGNSNNVLDTIYPFFDTNLKLLTTPNVSVEFAE